MACSSWSRQPCDCDALGRIAARDPRTGTYGPIAVRGSHGRGVEHEGRSAHHARPDQLAQPGHSCAGSLAGRRRTIAGPPGTAIPPLRALLRLQEIGAVLRSNPCQCVPFAAKPWQSPSTQSADGDCQRSRPCFAAGSVALVARAMVIASRGARCMDEAAISNHAGSLGRWPICCVATTSKMRSPQ